ncbi:MAG: hypothetical protein MI975_19575 [Cytophagales bacterium]|nr:hypothetical protein [Cytophagales bacterium]
MEDLKRLVKIISKRKQRQFPLLELKSINENSSKENIFFRYIKKGIINSDDDASRLLYGTKSDDDRFRMLKSRLKQKLLNHAFFLDFSENNQKSSSQYEQECIQQLHQAKMLLFTGENKIARSLVLKALTTAERCEFTKYKISCLEDLVHIYSESCQPHLFDDVIAQLEETRALYKKEVEAREHFYYMKMMVVKSVNSRKKNLENAAESIVKLEKIWNETMSFNVFEYLIQLILLHKELTGDFDEIIPILQEVESGKFRGQRLNINRLSKNSIIQSMSFAYFRAWDFESGINYVESNIDLMSDSASEWFNLSEIYFHLAIYSKKYKLANDIADKVFESKAFEKKSEKDKEKWRLFNAYLQLIYAGNFYMGNFNFKTLIEHIPEYHKEKEGINFAIIILQFLYFIEQRDLNELSVRRDELKRYMANHFKENFSYRSRTIYKLLNIVVENALDLKSIQLKSRYLVKKLNENRVVGNAYQELEIVPYEHLWDLIMRMLKYGEVRGF